METSYTINSSRIVQHFFQGERKDYKFKSNQLKAKLQNTGDMLEHKNSQHSHNTKTPKKESFQCLPVA